MRGELYIHIGFRKCASKSLQFLLFSRHDELTYFAGQPKRGPGENCERAQEAMRWFRGAHTESQKGADFAQKLAEESVVPALESGKKVVLSDEALVDHKTAATVHSFFPNAKVVAIIRRPVDMYISQYHQYLKGQGRKYARPKEIDQWITDVIERRGCCRFANLNEYIDVFGKDRVGVFLFEHLRENQEAFIIELGRFLEIDTEQAVRLFCEDIRNPRITNYGVLAHRIRVFNPALFRIVLSDTWAPIRHLAKRIVPPRPVQKSASEDVIVRINDACRQSLRELVQRVNPPLEDYGYPL